MTYKILRDLSSDNESGIEPVKLLFDKSLQIEDEVTQLVSN